MGAYLDFEVLHVCLTTNLVESGGGFVRLAEWI